MTILSRMIIKLRRIIRTFWDNDPLRRRPLAGLAHQEDRMRSKAMLRHLKLA